MSGCAVPACDQPARALGRCVRHYRAHRRSRKRFQRLGLGCLHGLGCTRAAEVCGLCFRHYMALRRRCARGETTWERSVAVGQALPSRRTKRPPDVTELRGEMGA